MRFANLLCPIDFSSDSREAMRTAMALAGAQGRVTLVHVYTIPVIGPPELPIAPALVEAIVAGAEQGVREWTAEARKLGPAQVESCCLQGNPWAAIVDLARDRQVDLVVMGTHGRTALRHALLGSVAERVLRHAPCPVLVVREVTP
jgi:nucleotide-binding universal stress UspA family protein